MPGAGGNGTGWLPGGQGGAGVLRGDALRKGRRSGTGHLQHGRGGFQHQLPQAAGRNFIRQAGPAPRQENENRLVHQCRCAGKAALRGPHRGGGAGIPAICKIEIYLRRGAFKGYGPGRAHPHPLPDDRYRHRAAQLHGAEFAEHPHPNGSWQRNSPDVYSGGGLRLSGRGLLSDRAAAAGPHFRGRGYAGGVYHRSGHPHRNGGPGVPCGPRRCDPRDAPPGESRELRYRLRHLRLFPQSGHRRDGGGGQGVYGGLFRHLPRCAEVYG